MDPQVEALRQQLVFSLWASCPLRRDFEDLLDLVDDYTLAVVGLVLAGHPVAEVLNEQEPGP